MVICGAKSCPVLQGKLLQVPIDVCSLMQGFRQIRAWDGQKYLWLFVIIRAFIRDYSWLFVLTVPAQYLAPWAIFGAEIQL